MFFFWVRFRFLPSRMVSWSFGDVVSFLSTFIYIYQSFRWVFTSSNLAVYNIAKLVFLYLLIHIFDEQSNKRHHRFRSIDLQWINSKSISGSIFFSLHPRVDDNDGTPAHPSGFDRLHCHPPSPWYIITFTIDWTGVNWYITSVFRCTKSELSWYICDGDGPYCVAAFVMEEAARRTAENAYLNPSKTKRTRAKRGTKNILIFIESCHRQSSESAGARLIRFYTDLLDVLLIFFARVDLMKLSQNFQ